MYVLAEHICTHKHCVLEIDIKEALMHIYHTQDHAKTIIIHFEIINNKQRSKIYQRK